MIKLIVSFERCMKTMVESISTVDAERSVIRSPAGSPRVGLSGIELTRAKKGRRCHTPLIIHWPENPHDQRETISHEVGLVMDIMPTCVEIAGVEYPRTFQYHALFPLEGKSLLPILLGKKEESQNRTLFFEHEGGRVVREGDWKLVANKNSPQHWELYHMANDLSETNDLAATYPDRVNRMAEAWQVWAKRVHIMD